jgi:hypothetical protein
MKFILLVKFFAQSSYRGTYKQAVATKLLAKTTIYWECVSLTLKMDQTIIITLFSLRDTAMRLKSQRPLHIACARRCRSYRLARWWTKKNNRKKMEGQGGEEAQGVADPPKKPTNNYYNP